MDVSVLRIGNIVGVTSSEYPSRVDGVKSHVVWITCMGSHSDRSTEDTGGIESLYHIPLTDDELAKWDVSIEFTEHAVTIYTSQGDHTVYRKQCMYIDQLQNWYHSVVGEELPLKEDAA